MSIVKVDYGELMGSTEKYYSVIINNSVWFIICNNEVLYDTGSGQGGFYKLVNYSDDYVTITSSASSYDFTITYKKNCEENYLNGSTSTITPREANDTRTCTITAQTVFVKFAN